MNVKFHEKYQPLFDLLLAKETIEDRHYFENISRTEQEYWTALSKVDTVLMSGGRDSGKSFGLGCFAGIGAVQFEHRILFTRQTMSSTSNSIVKALESRLELLKIDDMFDYANSEYSSRVGKGLISITGQKTSAGTQTAKLKSLEGYSIFITDEGEELTASDDWKKTKRSIRAKDVQSLSIISFNPPTKSHWMFEEFYTNIPDGFNGIVDNVMYIHTTYLDNGRENMTEANWLDYEKLRSAYEYYLSVEPEKRILLPKKIQRDYREYKSTCLGAFRDIAEGVIFDYTIGDFVEPEYGVVFGLDQGFTDPTACVKVHVDKNQRKIWLKEILYKTNQTTEQIWQALQPEVAFTRIWCDSAVPMFIKDLHTKGLNIRACKKPKITDSINSMLNYELIIDKNSLNLQRELNLYRWNDKRADEPVDDNNHAIDAARYAITHKLTERIAQTL